MVLIILLGAAAALTWYLDKTYGNVTDFINPEGVNIKKSPDGNYPDLGYKRQLAKNLPWGAQRARRIGDWSSKNPNPVIDIQGGGENTRVQPMPKQPILPNQKKNFIKLVHNRENIEEYFRFDQYLGGIYPDKMATTRRRAI
jgi:hypothetical protein